MQSTSLSPRNVNRANTRRDTCAILFATQANRFFPFRATEFKSGGSKNNAASRRTFGENILFQWMDKKNGSARLLLQGRHSHDKYLCIFASLHACLQ
jgi:hypothetical protein